MELNEAQQNEINSMGRMLSKIAELAEQAGLTGCFENGAGRCAVQYNSAVTRLEQIGAIPPSFFATLPTDAGFGEVGVASAQLASYIDASAPQADKATYHGPKYNIMNHNSKMSDEEKQELRELRDLLRKQRANREN